MYITCHSTFRYAFLNCLPQEIRNINQSTTGSAWNIGRAKRCQSPSIPGQPNGRWYHDRNLHPWLRLLQSIHAVRNRDLHYRGRVLEDSLRYHDPIRMDWLPIPSSFWGWLQPVHGNGHCPAASHQGRGVNWSLDGLYDQATWQVSSHICRVGHDTIYMPVRLAMSDFCSPSSNTNSNMCHPVLSRSAYVVPSLTSA